MPTWSTPRMPTCGVPASDMPASETLVPSASSVITLVWTHPSFPPGPPPADGQRRPTPATNKVCLSGMNAIAQADQAIRAGEFEVVVAGGMESMTNAPHLLPNLRRGQRYGDATIVDHMALDGLTDAWDACSMGALTERGGVRL